MNHIFSILLGIMVLAAGAFGEPDRASAPTDRNVLYNGIRLLAEWPPRGLDSATRDVPPVPYLVHRPDTVPIDVGRQLFVDDFLIENTTLKRVFHQPAKYEGNPVLKPETELEKNHGISPVAVPFSDGAFFDPADNLYKMWYMAGWFDGVALATSTDGIHWRRPAFDVVPGTNQVVAPKEDLRRDGVTVWLDRVTEKREERFKMFLYARKGELGHFLAGGEGNLLTSPDGVHWIWRGKTGRTEDNTGFFYNAFRKTWVFSHRTGSANSQHWRVRSYWETRDFLDAIGGWKGCDPVFWVGADSLDLPHPDIREVPQLYKVDAAPYESLMLGLMEVHYGPPNRTSAAHGIPKLTELQIAFSRDGFHWDRSARTAFIGATLQKDSWERAYLTSVGGVCLVVGDKLYFYYGAFQGDESHAAPLKGTREEQQGQEWWSGMYANGSTGLATLRRDGFASMDADREAGTLTTRPVVFHGKHLFVNANCSHGNMRAEILDPDSGVLPAFSKSQCVPVAADSTIQEVRWSSGGDLSALAGRRIRFRFHLSDGSLYSFWVSPDQSGASLGYVAAGGPGFTSDVDTVGVAAYRRTNDEARSGGIPAKD